MEASNYLDFKKPDAYSPYTAGPKTYGLGGANAPQVGPMGATGMAGYMERDAEAKARRNAILQRMKRQQASGGTLPVGAPQVRGAV